MPIEILDNPSIKLSGFDWSRRKWKTINRLRCNVGRCGHWFFKWGSDKSCDCGAIDQTPSHIMNSCNLRKFQGIHFKLLEGKSQRAIDWIVQLDLNI